MPCNIDHHPAPHPKILTASNHLTQVRVPSQGWLTVVSLPLVSESFSLRPRTRVIECSPSSSHGANVKTLTAILSFFLLLVSCTPNPNVEIGDGGLLSDASCGPPCFWNITPGLTTRSQAWGSLIQRGMSQTCQELNGSSEPGSHTIHCEPRSKTRDLGTLDIALDAQANKVLSISFNPSRVILLQNLVKKYGGSIPPGCLPNKYSTTSSILGDTLLQRNSHKLVFSSTSWVNISTPPQRYGLSGNLFHRTELQNLP